MKGIFTELIRLKGYLPQIKLWSDLYSKWLTLTQFGSQIKLSDGTTDVMFSNLKCVKKTIGAYGVAGCDFNFTNPANTTAQNIDLGSIIPADARVLEVRVKNKATFTGGTTLAITAGNASAGAQFMASVQCYTLDVIVWTLLALLWAVAPANAATKVWIGATPGANWSGITAGKLEVNVFYLEQA